MPTIESLGTHERRLLRSTHQIGRAAPSHLLIDNGRVSRAHASIRWIGSSWEMKDLATPNGTWVNGSRIENDWVPLTDGARVAFGDPAELWRVTLDGPPVAFASTEQIEVAAVGDLLAVPDSERPVFTVGRSPDGGWQLESGDMVRPVKSEEVVEAAGRLWNLHLPTDGLVHSTVREAVLLENAAALFGVNANEEEVELTLEWPGRRIAFGTHTFLYSMLILARARLEETKTASKEPGWVDQEELIRQLKIKPNDLHLHVFRARKLIFKQGVGDANRIVERRNGARQIRFGVARIEVHSM